VSDVTTSLDVLINNAGVNMRAPYASGVLDLRSALERALAVNVFGPAVLTEEALTLLRASVGEGRRPRIVNVSSRLASIGGKFDPSLIAYNPSKTGLNAMTAHFANTFKEARVVSVCPGNALPHMLR
jgi:NAD(P)-dependent dehydrogenase (short-subunit alcohol dehydrogenase family)